MAIGGVRPQRQRQGLYCCSSSLSGLCLDHSIKQQPRCQHRMRHLQHALLPISRLHRRACQTRCIGHMRGEIQLKFT
ncbi:unnamed protein product [Urochloa humidicola]